MNLKKGMPLMLVSAVISIALSVGVSAQGLRFGTDFLTVNTEFQCLGATGFSGESQIALGDVHASEIHTFYFSLKDKDGTEKILGASSDSADDYEIMLEPLLSEDGKGFTLKCSKSTSESDGRMLVQLEAIPNLQAASNANGQAFHLPPIRWCGQSSEPDMVIIEDAVNEVLESPECQAEIAKTFRTSLVYALIIKSKSTGETRTINLNASIVE